MKLYAAELNAADTLIDHVCGRIDHHAQLGSPLRDRYVGFAAITASAHLETLVKNKVLDFCSTQNRYLLSVFTAEFSRFNGRIAYDELANLLERFDKDIARRFRNLVTRMNRYTMRTRAQSQDVFAGYKSLLTIRHTFSHNINAAFPQISSNDVRAYVDCGKRIAAAFVRCLPR